PVTDPQHPESLCGQRHAEVVVEPVGRAEHAAHGATACQDHAFRVAVTVPKDTEETAQRVHLEVVQRRCDLDVLYGEDLELVERPGHRSASRNAPATYACA